MASTTPLAELQRALSQLRGSVATLRSHHGDTAQVRRISNDIDRLDIDITELSSQLPQQRGAAAPADDVVLVPDTPYDPSLWRDADDEGLGGRTYQ
ncbi:hypothetical protein IQ251_18885 [Saccharopolyspora sp. HNM0983]|uniref:Uncharacterized protein n=1 Tax=Saccharopolyspora montiporae TaxID=2781240 RepID=A0A929FZ55_9PSEU|nr:hypothetical protein [Saccharopolyspora sp. HNM0983]MBE9376521.1 hypothetical protein [Saccharopolyspora sp. HNM0983]